MQGGNEATLGLYRVPLLLLLTHETCRLKQKNTIKNKQQTIQSNSITYKMINPNKNAKKQAIPRKDYITASG